MTKYFCPCCGYKTIDDDGLGRGIRGTFDICEICYWKDSILQTANPDYEGGANGIPLRQAQKNLMQFGASDKRVISFVRKTNEHDTRDSEWRHI